MHSAYLPPLDNLNHRVAGMYTVVTEGDDRRQLLKQEEEMKVELADLNRSLLARLAQSKGDILGDTDLIESLDSTKSTASRIAASLASAAALQVRPPPPSIRNRHPRHTSVPASRWPAGGPRDLSCRPAWTRRIDAPSMD